MKRLLVMGLSIVLAAPILASSFVFAVESTNTKPEMTSTPATRPTTKPIAVTTEPATPAELKLLAERIQKRKTELNIRLSNAEKLKIQDKCKASQGLTSSVSGRIKGIETSRAQVYSNVIDRLTKLSAKLKDSGENTIALDVAIATLKEKIALFNTDLTTYKQTVSDLAEMDCKADAEGFKASLESARSAQAKVNQDALAVRAYVNETIKPMLGAFKTKLETKKPEGSN